MEHTNSKLNEFIAGIADIADKGAFVDEDGGSYIAEGSDCGVFYSSGCASAENSKCAAAEQLSPSAPRACCQSICSGLVCECGPGP